MSVMAGAGRSVLPDAKTFRFDWQLLLAALVFVTAGLLALYSEGLDKPGGSSFGKQIFNIVLGLGPFALFYLVHPQAMRRNANALYVVNLVMLAAVLVAGKHEMGATRWIQLGPIRFEPSELAKLLSVFTLSSFYASRPDDVEKFSTFALSFVHILAPAALIFKQPHLGATLVMVTVWLCVSLTAGVKLQYIFGFVISAVVLFGLVWETPGVLKDYQKDRILGLLHGNAKDNGYQGLRAEIAFGSGGLLGEGFRQGEQKKARFIPEQHNDFIFTVVGEEGGLVGCSMVLVAFGFFYYRMWLIMLDATDPYYKMLVSGIFGMLGFHTIVNLGMILQLLPVVGLWLPFMSYGGTAMWLCMASVALLLNVRRRERPVLFN
jgi:rod shape determining protein RodA